jgi:hypothetical protein
MTHHASSPSCCCDGAGPHIRSAPYSIRAAVYLMSPEPTFAFQFITFFEQRLTHTAVARPIAPRVYLLSRDAESTTTPEHDAWNYRLKHTTMTNC